MPSSRPNLTVDEAESILRKLSQDCDAVIKTENPVQIPTDRPRVSVWTLESRNSQFPAIATSVSYERAFYLHPHPTSLVPRKQVIALAEELPSPWQLQIPHRHYGFDLLSEYCRLYIEGTLTSFPTYTFEQLLNSFSAQLSSKHIEWNEEHFIIGIIPSKDFTLQVGDNEVHCTRPTEDEIQSVMSSGYAIGRSIDQGDPPTCKLKFKTCIEENGLEVGELRLRICQFVLLYFGQRVWWTHSRRALHPFFDSAVNVIGHACHGETSLLLEAKEVKELQAFIAKVDFRVPMDWSQSSDRSKNALIVAYNHLENSAFRRGPTKQHRIAEVLFGLESLFTDGSDAEIKFRLKLFSNLIAKHVDMPWETLDSVIDQAYNIRSALVHGNITNGERWKKIAEEFGSVEAFQEELILILRHVIVLFSLYKGSKPEFPKELLRAILSGTVEGKLRAALEDYCSIVVKPVR